MPKEKEKKDKSTTWTKDVFVVLALLQLKEGPTCLVLRDAKSCSPHVIVLVGFPLCRLLSPLTHEKNKWH